MNKSVEQRICLKFCVSNEISCVNAFKMLQKTYGESTLSKTQVYEWYKTFKEGRESVEDMPRSGRPSTSTTEESIEKVKKIVLKNRRVSEREIADAVGISNGSVHFILTDILGMKRIAARLVPKQMNFLQKNHRNSVAEDMICKAQNDSTFMKRIITGDETWVYEYDTETSQQSSEWRFENEPKPKRPRQSRSKIKVMLTVFFDHRGVVHHEFLTDGQTVTKEYYLGVMRRLRESVRMKRPDLWKNNSWILRHDNAPSHTSIIVQEFLVKHSTNVIAQAPYSPDMAPCDFFLFPRLKLPLRGKRFETKEAVKLNSVKALKAIPSSGYEKGFEEWLRRWNMRVSSNGDYFEGDKLNLS